MRIGRNLKTELRIFLFQAKNIRSVLPVPILIDLVLIPVLLLLTMNKYGDISYVEENFRVLTQYFVPILSIWWISFAFIDFIEGEGNELHYVSYRQKDNLILLWLLCYLTVLLIGCAVASIWLGNVWPEFLRMVICSCFYVGLAYFSMFCLNSMTLSFLLSTAYWLSSAFGADFVFPRLNCYDFREMSMELLSEKYAYILLCAVILYGVGWIGNRRKEKYT